MAGTGTVSGLLAGFTGGKTVCAGASAGDTGRIIRVSLTLETTTNVNVRAYVQRITAATGTATGTVVTTTHEGTLAFTWRAGFTAEPTYTVAASGPWHRTYGSLLGWEVSGAGGHDIKIAASEEWAVYVASTFSATNLAWSVEHVED